MVAACATSVELVRPTAFPKGGGPFISWAALSLLSHGTPWPAKAPTGSISSEVVVVRQRPPANWRALMDILHAAPFLARTVYDFPLPGKSAESGFRFRPVFKLYIDDGAIFGRRRPITRFWHQPFSRPISLLARSTAGNSRSHPLKNAPPAANRRRWKLTLAASFPSCGRPMPCEEWCSYSGL